MLYAEEIHSDLTCTVLSEKQASYFADGNIILEVFFCNSEFA